MKRILLFALILFGFRASAFAQPVCTPGYTNIGLSASAIRTAVLDAIGAGRTAVTLCLAAGTSVDWENGVDISKDSMGNPVINTSIIGAGGYPTTCPSASDINVECGSAGQSEIHFKTTSGGQGGFVAWFPVAGGAPEIANIKFTYTTDDWVALPPFGPMFTVSSNSSYDSLTTPFKFHHNDIQFTGTNCAMNGHIASLARNHGLIYRNRVTYVGSAGSCSVPNNIVFLSPAVNDTGGTWQTASTMGTDDSGGTTNIYMEQNLVINLLNYSDLDNSSRVVMVGEEIHNSTVTAHGYDSGRGGRHMELINSHFHCDNVPSYGHIVISNYWNPRSLSGRIVNSTFDPVLGQPCAGGSDFPAVGLKEYKIGDCSTQIGWPGTPPDTYPIAHQAGWGWTGGYITVGAAADQNEPGNNSSNWITDGMQQSLEPYYFGGNTNNTTGKMSYIEGEQSGGDPTGCRARTWSVNSTTNAGTTVLQSLGVGGATPWASNGEFLIAVFGDAIGGTTPTIAATTTSTAAPSPVNTCGGGWTALNTPVSNSSTRLSAWTCSVTVSGQVKVTVSHDTSTAARALAMVAVRNVSSIDTHPPFVTRASAGAPANTFIAPSTGTMTDQGSGAAQDMVISFFALHDTFTNNSTNQSGTMVGPLQAGSPDALAAININAGVTSTGMNGTNGAASDISIAIQQRVVTVNTAITTAQITDSNSGVYGVAGIVSLIANGTTTNQGSQKTPFDINSIDIIQYNREVYEDCAATHNACGTYDASKGVGTGTTSTMNGFAATCVDKVGFWATDQGSWNHSRSTLGGSGLLYKCDGVGHAWNTFYTPYQFPHSLAVASILTQPASQGIASGATATMSVVGDNSSTALSYQWYQGSARDYSTPIMGATSSSYTTPALFVTANYWVDVINTGGDRVSNTATITVAGVPHLTSISPVSGTEGTTVPVTLTGFNLSCSTAVISVSGTGITVTSPTCVNSTTITANFVIADNASATARTVTATADGVSTDNNVTFTVIGGTPSVGGEMITRKRMHK